jgi:hypothetical protein
MAPTRSGMRRKDGRWAAPEGPRCARSQETGAEDAPGSISLTGEGSGYPSKEAMISATASRAKT